MDAGIDSLKIRDQEYCPTLSRAGQAMLDFLREHPAAPYFRNQSGNRLLAEEVAELREFEQIIVSAKVGWPQDGKPEWLESFIAETFKDVPYYRSLGPVAKRFEDIPTISRADLASDITRFVPDSVPIERLINFRTTGTTGNPLLIASHPLVAGRYLAFHKRALRRFGIILEHGKGQVGVVLLGMQKKCFTYVSVTPLMDESGLAKINLHPDDWFHPDDRASYLDALQPEVIAGDPISFSEFLSLPLRLRPRAILSVGMTLSSGLREALETRFQCPVLDLYSMNEVGPVGVFDRALDGHLLLQNRLYIEILDSQGRPVSEGQRGEITFTGGFNFCLPLVRYRSGDYASLKWTPEGPVIRRLSGRKPVRFFVSSGTWVNNIDVTHALSGLAISQYGLHQRRDHSLVLRLPNSAMMLANTASTRLAQLFPTQKITIEEIVTDGKVLQYTSDLPQDFA
ncbi:MAG: capsule biosynthesis protein CapK [Rhodocyclaceae bacterium]|nr:capsule biosynthesis protein CapK [Rhodocyclaceae bacterium]